MSFQKRASSPTWNSMEEPFIKSSFLHLQHPFVLNIFNMQTWNYSNLALSPEILGISWGPWSPNGSHSLTSPHLTQSAYLVTPVIFPQRVNLDTFRPHNSDCLFNDHCTLSPSIQSTDTFIPVLGSCLIFPDCLAFPNLHSFQHWECLAPLYFSTRNADPPASSRINGATSFFGIPFSVTSSRNPWLIPSQSELNTPSLSYSSSVTNSIILLSCVQIIYIHLTWP